MKRFSHPAVSLKETVHFVAGVTVAVHSAFFMALVTAQPLPWCWFPYPGSGQERGANYCL